MQFNVLPIFEIFPNWSVFWPLFIAACIWLMLLHIFKLKPHSFPWGFSVTFECCQNNDDTKSNANPQCSVAKKWGASVVSWPNRMADWPRLQRQSQRQSRSQGQFHFSLATLQFSGPPVFVFLCTADCLFGWHSLRKYVKIVFAFFSHFALHFVHFVTCICQHLLLLLLLLVSCCRLLIEIEMLYMQFTFMPQLLI